MSLFVESKQQARIEKYARVEHLKVIVICFCMTATVLLYLVYRCLCKD